MGQPNRVLGSNSSYENKIIKLVLTKTNVQDNVFELYRITRW